MHDDQRYAEVLAQLEYQPHTEIWRDAVNDWFHRTPASMTRSIAWAAIRDVSRPKR
jgi:alpha-glucuronidase